MIDTRNVKITSNSQYRTFVYQGYITEDEAKQLQEDLGYPWAGYSFLNYHQGTEEGEHGVKFLVTIWKCYNSCD